MVVMRPVLELGQLFRSIPATHRSEATLGGVSRGFPSSHRARRFFAAWTLLSA